MTTLRIANTQLCTYSINTISRDTNHTSKQKKKSDIMIALKKSIMMPIIFKNEDEGTRMEFRSVGHRLADVKFCMRRNSVVAPI